MATKKVIATVVHSVPDCLLASEPQYLRHLKWQNLQVDQSELMPYFTLVSGQCFNWHRLENSNVWVGVVDRQPLAISQTKQGVLFASLLDDGDQGTDIRNLLQSYLQLDINIANLYKQWGQQCSRMHAVAQCIQGLRVLRQDPWECLISFITSSNNNIKRIIQGLQKVREIYGDYLCTLQPPLSGDTDWIVHHSRHEYAKSNSLDLDFISQYPISTVKDIAGSPAAGTHGDGSHAYSVSKVSPSPSLAQVNPHSSGTRSVNSTTGTLRLHTFPTPEQLSEATEGDFREIGMGYRARFLTESCRQVLANGGESWLTSLRENPSRLEVQEALMTLPGIGRKVADCVALFSLDKCEAVPVDTHVWDIAVRDYAPSLSKAKSLTPPVYEQVGDTFRTVFPNKSGWAHSVLFAGELPEFRQLLPLNMQEEMGQFSAAMKAKKADVKQKRAENVIKGPSTTSALRTPRNRAKLALPCSDGSSAQVKEEKEESRSIGKKANTTRKGGDNWGSTDSKIIVTDNEIDNIVSGGDGSKKTELVTTTGSTERQMKRKRGR